MKISAPCIITSRLMTGIKIGDSTISIEYDNPKNGRHCYRYYIDLPNGVEFTSNDLSALHGGLQSGLSALLSFLSASAESYAYDIRNGGDGMGGENSELFPKHIVEWAHMNSDELSMASLELEETENVIEE